MILRVFQTFSSSRPLEGLPERSLQSLDVSLVLNETKLLQTVLRLLQGFFVFSKAPSSIFLNLLANFSNIFHFLQPLVRKFVIDWRFNCFELTQVTPDCSWISPRLPRRSSRMISLIFKHFHRLDPWQDDQREVHHQLMFYLFWNGETTQTLKFSQQYLHDSHF